MPLVDLANPLSSGALAQLAGPFGSYLGGGSFPSSYEFAKRFVSNAKTAGYTGNNGVTSLDDPTYLGFSLMFDILSPLFNGATIGDSGITKPLLDPRPNVDQTLADAGLVNNASATPSSGNSSYPSTPSAIAYLNKIGEANRAEYLRAFIQGIQEIVKTRPYYFQTITGLLEAWNKSVDFAEDPYTGSTGSDGIAIGCLEAIDLKITALFSLYRLAVYDVRMKRFVLPRNLMKFTVYVDVHEIRRFKTVRNWIDTFNPSNASPDASKFVNENSSNVRFKFTDCEWDVSASGKVFDGVTNTGGNIATTELKWNYSLLEMVSQFSGYDSSLQEDKQLANSDPSFAGKLKSFGKDQLNNLADGAINLAKRTVSSAVQGITLGNVFGLRNELLGTLSNPQGLINAAVGAAIQGGGVPASNIGLKNTNLGDNPLGDPAAPLQTINSAKAFDASTNTLGGLNSTNAFGPSGPPQDNGGLASSNIFE